MLERHLKIFAALLRQRDKYATRPTWLAQKALSGMKVVTPRLNWIPLSSTLGHGVSVLASGRLPIFGLPPTSHSPSWAFRATTGHFFEDKVIESLLCKSSSWIVQFLEKVVYVPAVVQFFDKVNNSFFVVFRYKLLVLAQLDLLRSWKEIDPYLFSISLWRISTKFVPPYVGSVQMVENARPALSSSPGGLTPHSARSSNRARQWQLIRAELPSNGYPQPSGSSKKCPPVAFHPS